MRYLDLDANASHSPTQELLSRLFNCSQNLANPSSLHRPGQRARAALEEARESVRRLVNAAPRDKIVFTSGASEGNNTVILAVTGALSQSSNRGKKVFAGHIISSAIEHPCVLAPFKLLEGLGLDIDIVPPNSNGEVDCGAVARIVREDTKLVSLMAANNETGVVNNIAQLAKAVRERNRDTFIHTDAAQLVGKTPIDFSGLGVDFMTVSGHKFGALSGIGALVVREEVEFNPLILGGPQEGKFRGGTENLLGAISLNLAASDILSEGSKRFDSMRRVRDCFELEVVKAIPGCSVNGSSAARLPNTSSVYIPGVRADDLVVALDLLGVGISSGAACSSGKPEPSHVLLAMGQAEERVRSTVRVSFRADSKEDDAVYAAGMFLRAVNRMRYVNY
jgi:cysteine desulfurase